MVFSFFQIKKPTLRKIANSFRVVHSQCMAELGFELHSLTDWSGGSCSAGLSPRTPLGGWDWFGSN